MVLLLCLGSDGHAWALKSMLDDPALLRSTLTSKVLKNHRIRYCLVMEEPCAALPRGTVKLELLMALSLWTKPLGPCGYDEVTPDQPWDLKVEVGRTPAGDTSHGAFCRHLGSGVVIRINSDFVWTETRSLPSNPNGTYTWHTLTSVLGPGVTFERVARDAAQRHLSLDDLAVQYTLSHSTLFYTSYRAFVHELGHAFGLADTNSEQLARQNDGRWRSPGEQPNSVMKTSNFLYLTPDDLAGLRAVAGRLP